VSRSTSADVPFEVLFGRAATHRAGAPGRVNLMGDHTDYNLGFVFPAAIPQKTAVEVSPVAGIRVRAWSREIGRTVESYAVGEEAAGRGWLDHVQAVTFVLRREGVRFDGFDVRIESSIPPGSGLSSSAALSVALLRALAGAFSLSLDDRALARLAQRAENDFIGAPVGIMDPMAVILASPGTALFLDTRSLAWERVPIPRGAELVVVHSGISHSIAAEGYGARRAECERAAGKLGVGSLRELSADDLPRIDLLEPPLNRRVRHVVTENERVLSTVAAFRDERLEDAGRMFAESHRSLSRDFEVSPPEVDALVDLAGEEPGVYGARITGGGFGGAVVMLATRGHGARAAAAVVRRYGTLTGRKAAILVPDGPGSAPDGGTRDT